MNLVYDDILKLNLKPVYAKRTSILTSTSIACLEVLFLFHLQYIRPFGSTYGYAPLFISSPTSGNLWYWLALEISCLKFSSFTAVYFGCERKLLWFSAQCIFCYVPHSSICVYLKKKNRLLVKWSSN